MVGSGFLGVRLGVVGGLGMLVVVRAARARRLKKCDEQMPQALEIMALALRAGHALPSALALAADETPPPLAAELQRAADENALGKPLGEVRESLGERLPGRAAVHTLVVAVPGLPGAGGGASRRRAPSAVTEVTGFGLAGNAAERAEASGLEIELDLGALPALPGAIEAAAEGMVPLGAAKNRESLGGQLRIDGDCDPLLIDLAFDPQTSGGLLAACSPEAAPPLCAEIPGARVVGRCLDGAAGRVCLRAGLC